MANRRVSHDDVIVQLAVTVGCAYISFFVAQYIFGNTYIHALLFIIYVDLFMSYVICTNYTVLFHQSRRSCLSSLESGIFMRSAI